MNSLEGMIAEWDRRANRPAHTVFREDESYATCYCAIEHDHSAATYLHSNLAEPADK